MIPTSACFSCAVCLKSLHTFGREMAYLKSTGRKIENFDMAIGATALQNKMVMVTDNTDHLGRIRGIEIENWKTNEPNIQGK